MNALFAHVRPELVLAAGPRSSFGLELVSGAWGVALKALLPVAGYLLVAPVLWWFFRRTWAALDAAAAEHQQAVRAAGRYDPRPPVLFAITALVLTLQEYYGGRDFYYFHIRPLLRQMELAQLFQPGGLGQLVDLSLYSDLYAYAWWALTRIVGYVFVPLAIWKLVFRRDRLLDMGLRTRGLRRHAWIYGLCLLIVVPLVVLVSFTPDFANYYPFYKNCSRSWMELFVWEGMYCAQFLALEIFFRGFWLSALRQTLGSGAIFAMCVPYVMIHYGKPYLEASAALVAGVALGSLAMMTRSIYSGFLVHISVAILMDFLALLHGRGLPTVLLPRF
ncbi:MAG: CPBP family intramembrane metalloprotease [Deltaproteobacteria bacterium]|nr:CPBP family intramembrane metalloprotease [Deltaproteobacteria bacterium]